jgi:hypothetical protein
MSPELEIHIATRRAQRTLALKRADLRAPLLADARQIRSVSEPTLSERSSRRRGSLTHVLGRFCPFRRSADAQAEWFLDDRHAEGRTT